MFNPARTRLAALGAALVMTVFPLAACGSTVDNGPKVAQAQDRTAGAPTSGAAAKPDPAKWAACMRENGIQVDDPKPGGGVVAAGEATAAAGDITQMQAKMEAATKACQQYMPVQQGGPANFPEELKKQMLAVASCMRAAGFPDFPDPDFSNGGVTTLGSPSGATDPKYPSTLEGCIKKSGIGGAPAGGSGTISGSSGLSNG